MLKVKKIFVLSFMILSFVTLPLKTYAVDNGLEPTAAPVMTDTAIDDVAEPTAAPVTNDIATTVINDVPKQTTAPVTNDITTETTVVTTQIPQISDVVYTTPISLLYQRLYHLDINNMPNKTDYNIGDELDLTGLTVDLRYNDERNIYYNTDYINAYPPDYPDVFIIDTSKFDNSKAGTYTIEISCKYEAINWYPPSAYLKVTVNDPNSAVTTTSASPTDITTTETTVATTSIPKISDVVYTTPFVIYESAYVHSLKSPPDKTVYEIGDELDLTGLKVDLEFYDQQGGHHTICRDAYPPDYPDAFIIDTSNFDSSKAGTYKIKVSCADKFTAFFLPGPVYFEVEVIEKSPEPTEPTGWYESQYEISIKSLPDRTAYEIGDELDLTGLKVNLDFYDQHGEHHNICSYVSPQDGPDVFIVDTSEFDSSKAGTYKIKISCTDKYQSFLPTYPVSFEVTVTTETKLPQTGYPKWYQSLIVVAIGMIGVGSTAIVKSGFFRKKKSNS